MLYIVGTQPSTNSAKSEDYPLAVKMMFNYDTESNAIAILRSMYREMVPLQNTDTKAVNFWENELVFECRPETRSDEKTRVPCL